MEGSNGNLRGPRSSQSNGPARGPPPGQDPKARQASVTAMSPPPGAAAMTRAERFESEKRRIIESCFSKMDNTGILLDSYITHIRVEEDAAYPQSPPPPDSPPSNKKARVVIVAVRNSGRVRLHKARENSNGTFSIGKTWNLDDLTRVQSYSSPNPITDEDVQHAQWAGDSGFTVTLIKPYYWQAGTAKEKEFFIGSLVKIYRKYTQGKVPELVGFSTKEVEQMLGVPGQRGPPSQSRPPPVGAGQSLQSPQPLAAVASPRSKSTSQPPEQRRPSQGAPTQPPVSLNDRPPLQARGPSPQTQAAPLPYAAAPVHARQPRRGSSQERIMRQPASREQVVSPPERDMRQPSSRDQPRPMQLQAASVTSSQRLTPQSSLSEITAPRSESPAASSISSKEPAVQLQQSPRKRGQPDAMSSGRQAAASTTGPSSSTMSMWRPNGAPSEKREQSPRALRPPTSQSMNSSVSSRNDQSVDEPIRSVLPERKRPPILGLETKHSQQSLGRESPSGGVTPLAVPQQRREDFRSPSRESNDSQKPSASDRMPGGFYPSPAPSDSIEQDGVLPKSPVVIPAYKPDDAEEEPDTTLTPTEPVASPSVRSPSPKEEDEDYRPGLGPMVKKKTAKDVATTFRKAATAYNAFKPRAGGAGDKLRQLQTKTSNEPDGITGVVPAPSLARVNSDMASTEAAKSPTTEQPPVLTAETEEVPHVTVSEALTPAPLEPRKAKEPPPQARDRSPAPEESAAKAVEIEQARKNRRRSNQQAKYLSALGIDARLLDGRGLEFESILTDFGWTSNVLHPKKIEVLEADLRRELGRVEAGSWLGHLEQKDERVEAVGQMLDKAIAECDELEGLLTLYGVELSSLNEDIAFIEAQSQGLQVQTANQKLLQTELQHLVDTISITPQQLEPLKRGSIGSRDGLEMIEESLLLLYRAMTTINPVLRQGNMSGRDNRRLSTYATNEIANMRALQEKKDLYMSESMLFLERLKQFMDMTFGAALMKTKDALEHSSAKSSTKLDVAAHDLARTGLWQYSPMLLFAKEMDIKSWEALLKMYQARARPLYQDELRDNTLAWKRITRKPTGEEQDVLFTTQEKEGDGLSSTARKLTVKRSQTLARSLRSASGDKASPTDKSQPGKSAPHEIFTGALDEMTPLLFTEQNFIVDFFHATSAENTEFAEALAAGPPETRRGTNLYARKLYEPDRAMAKRVADAMAEIFASWPGDLQNFIDWAIQADPLQGLPILQTLHTTHASLEETNQDFLTSTLSTLASRLTGLLTRFVDEQIRAIEETKVKIKKRKGVIAFVKVFPNFAAAVEALLPPATAPAEQGAQGAGEVRRLVDEAYARINRAMWESLKVIAKESPGQGAVGVGAAGLGIAEMEDKEVLNYHILLIENMNHYVEEVESRGDAVLEEWRGKAVKEMEEHLALYVDAVIRRPLGKVLDFLDATQSANPTTPARSAFKKLVAAHDAKELRRGVDALKKRVEKHFGDADDPSLSRGLVAKVLKACEARYVEVVERLRRVDREVYEGEGEAVGIWRVEDVSGVFRR